MRAEVKRLQEAFAAAKGLVDAMRVMDETDAQTVGRDVWQDRMRQLNEARRAYQKALEAEAAKEPGEPERSREG